MPPLYSWRRAAALTLLSVPLGLHAEAAYQSMPQLQLGALGAPLPMLSIVIPARDEERNLPRLLGSLQALNYPGPYEIIVVDDNSTDATARVAADHGARLISLRELPTTWLGKPHACHRGAATARGDWILFTDADTVHAPDGPAAAVNYAVRQNLDGLSLFIRQEAKGWPDRLALMVAFAGLFAGLGWDGALNGQYILLRRHVYFDSGGFEAVRDQPLEDLALGHRLRELGYDVPLMLGNDIASVRMYQNTSQVWAGMTRLGSGSLRWAGPSSVMTALFISAVMSPLIATAGVLGGRLNRWWMPVTWAAAILSMVPWARRFGSAYWALLAPLAAFVVQVAAVYGILAHAFGRGIAWKGRRV